MMNKKIKIALISLVSAFVLVFAVLCVAVSKKNVKLAQIKQENIELKRELDSISDYSKKLAEINGIQVTVEFNLKTTNVLGINTNNCQNVAKEIAQYTRGELLDSLNKR